MYIKTDPISDVYLLELMFENHVVNDNKVRPSPCKQCLKSFSQTNDFKEHLKMFTYNDHIHDELEDNPAVFSH